MKTKAEYIAEILRIIEIVPRDFGDFYLTVSHNATHACSSLRGVHGFNCITGNTAEGAQQILAELRAFLRDECGWTPPEPEPVAEVAPSIDVALLVAATSTMNACIIRGSNSQHAVAESIHGASLLLSELRKAAK